jgi:hypothetical protein
MKSLTITRWWCDERWSLLTLRWIYSLGGDVVGGGAVVLTAVLLKVGREEELAAQ